MLLMLLHNLLNIPAMSSRPVLLTPSQLMLRVKAPLNFSRQWWLLMVAVARLRLLVEVGMPVLPQSLVMRITHGVAIPFAIAMTAHMQDKH